MVNSNRGGLLTVCVIFSRILLIIIIKRNWFKWRLTIKTVTGALYKVFGPNVQSQLLCTEQCNVGLSKVSRRTVDTGTSLVADGMSAKTLQFWPTQTDHSRPVTQPLGTHGRRASTGSSAGQPVCLWQTKEDDDDPQYQHIDADCRRGIEVENHHFYSSRALFLT